MGSYDSMLTVSKGPAGKAAVLGIGTANPTCVVEQSTLPEYYFRITNSEHMVQLKDKFRRICESSKIDRRYTYDLEAMVKESPAVGQYGAASLDARQKLADVMIPALGAQAATKAISDWGGPMSEITHLVVCNSSGASMPGADYEIIKMLGLPLSTKRFMLYMQGCFGGGTALRLAKDLAENIPASRVLVVCSEPISISGFNGPCKDHIQNLVVQALFGDGAGAVVVGADPRPDVERLLFEIVWTSQNIIQGSDGVIQGKLRESGLMLSLQPEIPLHIAGSIGGLVKEALGSAGISDVNGAFYVVHTGGRAILDAIEMALGLTKEKLAVSREMLRDYGNMSSASVFFVMEAMRRRSEEKQLVTVGEGLEWGLLIGFGPGITVETIVLRCP
uniref:Putative chalcone synthase n=1 Tax=Muscari armeniacum TaxID=156613 RepID=A0A220T7R4_MUSAR|nr:putative chalcone synthase [Muscari armeniacum]